MNDEKKNVIIGGVLIIAAVGVIWFLTRGGSVFGYQLPASTGPDATATPDPESYVSYNLAPYNPHPNSGVPAVVLATGGCDCNSCGPVGGANNPVTSDISQFNTYI